MADGFRLRVCFGKTGRLRYLSHLECARACERSIRRAGLPYAVSQGFTPRMKMAFGPALPVGTAGSREYYDLTLTRFVGIEEAHERIARATVGELGPIACGYVSPSARSLGAELTIAVYELTVEGGIPPQEIGRALTGIVRNGTLGVDHKGKHKVFDLTEALPKEPEVESQGDRTLIRVWVRMGERGSLRPEAFVGAALEHDVRLRVDRTDLLVEDGEVWRRPL